MFERALGCETCHTEVERSRELRRNVNRRCGGVEVVVAFDAAYKHGQLFWPQWVWMLCCLGTCKDFWVHGTNSLCPALFSFLSTCWITVKSFLIAIFKNVSVKIVHKKRICFEYFSGHMDMCVVVSWFYWCQHSRCTTATLLIYSFPCGFLVQKTKENNKKIYNCWWLTPNGAAWNLPFVHHWFLSMQ